MYGGTKEEMQRLIADAAELSDTVDAQSMSFDNIVEAIHVVQTEMGITGTTAKEAATTIQGSVSAMKSAWRNLVTGLGDSNADLGKLIDNLVDSATTAFGNILPVAEQAINGIAVLIEKIAPVIAEKLPGLVDQVLPPLLSAAADIVNALVASLPSILQVLIDQAPMIIDTIVSTVISLLPEIIQLGLDLIIALANGIAENLPELIPTIIDVILQIVDTLTEPDNLVALVEASLAIIVALAEGLILSLPKLLEKAPEIIANLVMAIIGAVDALLSAAAEIISTLARGIADGFSKILEKGRELVEKVKQGIKEKISSLLSIGKDIVNGVKNGIANAWDSFTSWVTSKFTGLVNSVKRSLGIASPSKVFASIGGFMAEGLGEGWNNAYSKIKEQIVGDMDFKSATVDFASSGVGRYTSILQSAFGDLVASISQDATIIVQSVLDGHIIGETAYKYNLQTRRAYGV